MHPRSAQELASAIVANARIIRCLMFRYFSQSKPRVELERLLLQSKLLDMTVSRLLIALIVWSSLCAYSQDARFAPSPRGSYLANASYLVDFNDNSMTAFWVHYELLAHETTGPASRKDDFRWDARVENSAYAQSYRGSGFDRGHLKPAGDSKSSSQEMSQSFKMTNIIPQTPSLNRGIWRSLEENVRSWAFDFGSVHITTGPSFETTSIISGKLRAPAACWKAVLRTSPDTSAIAFWFPNDAEVSGKLTNYVLTVDELERRISTDLFPGLPDAIESIVESQSSEGAWSMTEGRGFNNAGHQCQGIASSTGLRCGNLTSNDNQYCHLHQDQSSNPIDTGLNQCKGIATSTSQRCRNMTKDASGYCHHHRESAGSSTKTRSLYTPSTGSRQCSGRAVSTGNRCRNKTTHPSGRCHHHRN